MLWFFIVGAVDGGKFVSGTKSYSELVPFGFTTCFALRLKFRATGRVLGSKVATLLLGIGLELQVPSFLRGWYVARPVRTVSVPPSHLGGVPERNIDALITLDYEGSHPIGGD